MEQELDILERCEKYNNMNYEAILNHFFQKDNAPSKFHLSNPYHDMECHIDKYTNIKLFKISFVGNYDDPKDMIPYFDFGLIGSTKNFIKMITGEQTYNIYADKMISVLKKIIIQSKKINSNVFDGNTKELLDIWHGCMKIYHNYKTEKNIYECGLFVNFTYIIGNKDLFLALEYADVETLKLILLNTSANYINNISSYNNAVRKNNNINAVNFVKMLLKNVEIDEICLNLFAVKSTDVEYSYVSSKVRMNYFSYCYQIYFKNLLYSLSKDKNLYFSILPKDILNEISKITESIKNDNILKTNLTYEFPKK